MKLQAFLYLLVRDHLPFGTVEAIIAEVEKTAGKEIIFSEEKFASYAASLASRLQEERRW